MLTHRYTASTTSTTCKKEEEAYIRIHIYIVGVAIYLIGTSTIYVTDIGTISHRYLMGGSGIGISSVPHPYLIGGSRIDSSSPSHRWQPHKISQVSHRYLNVISRCPIGGSGRFKKTRPRLLGFLAGVRWSVLQGASLFHAPNIVLVSLRQTCLAQSENAIVGSDRKASDACSSTSAPTCLTALA